VANVERLESEFVVTAFQMRPMRGGGAIADAQPVQANRQIVYENRPQHDSGISISKIKDEPTMLLKNKQLIFGQNARCHLVVESKRFILFFE
jgi:hypothetical protein